MGPEDLYKTAKLTRPSGKAEMSTVMLSIEGGNVLAFS